MTDTWTELTRAHGPVAVVNPNISTAELDRITEYQIATLKPLIAPLLRRSDQIALDYGCGAGRLTPMLAELVPYVTGYDPCKELLSLAPQYERVWWESDTPLADNNVIFVHGVMGEPNLDPELTALHIGTLLAPRGLLILVDHMPEIAPAGTWWKMRRASYYQTLFAPHGIPLTQIGTVQQLDRTMTVLAGRKQSC